MRPNPFSGSGTLRHETTRHSSSPIMRPSQLQPGFPWPLRAHQLKHGMQDVAGGDGKQACRLRGRSLQQGGQVSTVAGGRGCRLRERSREGRPLLQSLVGGGALKTRQLKHGMQNVVENEKKEEESGSLAVKGQELEETSFFLSQPATPGRLRARQHTHRAQNGSLT